MTRDASRGLDVRSLQLGDAVEVFMDSAVNGRQP